MPESHAQHGSEVEAKIVAVPGGPSWQYEYTITDHLGNTRAVYSDLNGNGSISA